MVRINLAAKALLAALKELSWTLLWMVVLGVLVLKYPGLNLYIVGALASYLPSFISAYHRSYAKLLRSSEKQDAAAPRAVRESEAPTSKAWRVGAWRIVWGFCRWLAIAFVCLVILWLLFNLYVWIYGR
jgi:hypothetical protein